VDQMRTLYVDDLSLHVLTEGELITLDGGDPCDGPGEPDMPCLVLRDSSSCDDHGLFGGRAAARELAVRLLGFVEDDRNWSAAGGSEGG
jgi:hypothetical protein